MSSTPLAQDIAKRQIALLGKMLLFSIDHLTEEEHQVYDSLVEELAGRADARREASPQAPRAPRPAESIPEPPPRGQPKPDYSQFAQNKKLQGLKPEMVVRLFVECWGKQDFKQEYFCLSDHFRQGNRARQTMDEYVNHRYEKYSRRHITGPLTKQIVDISAPIVDGDIATVQAAERHTGKDDDMILYRTYTLMFEGIAWRIVDFKTNQKRVRRRI